MADTGFSVGDAQLLFLQINKIEEVCVRKKVNRSVYTAGSLDCQWQM